MKTSKIIIALLLVTVMVFGIAACKKTAPVVEAPPTTGTDPAPVVTEAPVVVEPVEKTKITFSFWGNPEEFEVTDAVLQKFNEQSETVEVVGLQFTSDDYNVRMQALATSGDMPDCGMIKEDTAISWAEMGILGDASTLYEGLPKPLESITFKFDGKEVAYSNAQEILMLYYNKAMFDAAEVAYPPATLDAAWSWDEFVDVAKKLTIDKNGKNASEAGFDKKNIVQYGCSVNTITWQLEVWALSNGGRFYSEDGKALMLDDPATIEALQMIADLHLVHGVAPMRPGTTDDQIPSTIGAGNVAMATCGQWNVGTFFPQYVADGGSYGIGVLPYMKNKVTIATAGPVGVFASSPNAEAAGEFVRWYNSAENNWGLIESGIWMPATADFYTDEAKLQSWIGNPNFPAEYRTAVVDVAKDPAVNKPTGWYYSNNVNKVYNVLQPALVEAFNGTKTVADVIAANLDALKAAHAGN